MVIGAGESTDELLRSKFLMQKMRGKNEFPTIRRLPDQEGGEEEYAEEQKRSRAYYFKAPRPPSRFPEKIDEA